MSDLLSEAWKQRMDGQSMNRIERSFKMPSEIDYLKDTLFQAVNNACGLAWERKVSAESEGFKEAMYRVYNTLDLVRDYLRLNLQGRDPHKERRSGQDRRRRTTDRRG